MLKIIISGMTINASNVEYYSSNFDDIDFDNLIIEDNVKDLLIINIDNSNLKITNNTLNIIKDISTISIINNNNKIVMSGFNIILKKFVSELYPENAFIVLANTTDRYVEIKSTNI